jgi:ankyrin repeat protein
MELPRSLYCLTLAHSLDDRDVVEQLLTDFPEETEHCIPIALRTMLTVEYLPPVPFFSSRELLEYLPLLWNYETLDNKLSAAATEGLIYFVAYYLDRGANIHTFGEWPLITAAIDDHTETVKLLLDRKADIHAYNDAVLGIAARHYHTETVKLLLDRNADIHAGNDSALRWAAENGHTDTVKLLLDRKANIHAINDYALRFAARNGHAETVNILRSYMN